MYRTIRTGVATKSVITVNIGYSLRFDFFTLDVVGERILLTVSWSGLWELLSKRERDICIQY